MKNLAQLDPNELRILHKKVVKIRQDVIDLVQEYGESASTLVSKTFQGNIEREFGRKKLK